MPTSTLSPAEVRAAAEQRVRDIAQEAVDAGRASAEEAQAQTSRQLDELIERIKNLEAAGSRHELPGADSARGADGEKFDFAKVIRSLGLRSEGDPTWREHAAMEWEMSDQVRANAISPDDVGGFLVPGSVMTDQLIPLLRPQLIATMLGAVETEFVTSPVDIPREVTDPTIEALAENELGTASTPTFGQMRMEGHRAQAYLEISRQLLANGPGAQQILTTMMVRRLALEINQWTLSGEGGDEPIGILNSSGIGTVSFSGITINSTVGVPPAFYTKFLEFEERLEDANAFAGAARLGFAVPVKIKRAARQVKSEGNVDGTANLDMARQFMSSGVDPELVGFPYMVSTQLSGGAESEVIFGDWSQVIMATFGPTILEASNVAGDALKKGQTHVVASMNVDTGILQPGAFAVSASLNLSSF